MIIPLEQITPEILDNIVREYVLQEGTEYGLEDVELNQKIAQVKQQLIDKTAVIVYSELHETVNIMPKSQFEQGDFQG